MTIRRTLEGVRAKNLEEKLFFFDFSDAFDSKYRGKIKQIFLSNGFLEKTAIIVLYKNTKVKVLSLDRDTDYFDIVAGVLQGGTLAPYLFIISLDYVLRTSLDLMKENTVLT